MSIETMVGAPGMGGRRNYNHFILSRLEERVRNMVRKNKENAIAFAEFARDIPGNMWMRANGQILTTEELYKIYQDGIKDKQRNNKKTKRG